VRGARRRLNGVKNLCIEDSPSNMESKKTYNIVNTKFIDKKCYKILKSQKNHLNHSKWKKQNIKRPDIG
jgi:hypothetical protein